MWDFLGVMFLAGFAFGILRTWNKRIYFLVVALLISTTLVGMIIAPSHETVFPYEWYVFMVSIGVFWCGMFGRI